MRIGRIVGLFVIAVLLAACGGGGGGSSGGGGSRDNFTLQKSSLSFAADRRELAPPAQIVTGAVSGVNETVYAYVNATNNAIESADFYFSGGYSGSLSVSVKAPALLAAGSYSDTITVRICYDSSCGRQVSGSPKTIAVTYTITDEFYVETAPLNFSAVAGSNTIPAGSFLIGGSQSMWTASSNQSWIHLSKVSGNGGSIVGVQVDNTGLPAGNYSGTVTVTDQRTNTQRNINVSYLLDRPEFSISSPESLSFQGARPDDFDTKELLIQLNTSHAFNWVVDSEQTPTWLQLSATDGSVGENDDLINVSVNSLGLTHTEYSGNLVLTADVNGDAISTSIPVSLRLEPLRIELEKRGVAFSSVVGSEKLSASVAITTNRLSPLDWSTAIEYQADQTDVEWLDVAQVGDNEVSITADPAGLVDGQIYYASIIVSSTSPGVTNSGEERIAIGFYVNHADSVLETEALTITNPERLTGIVSDPIRPYVYLTHGGSTVEVYHVYTNELVKSITSLGGDLRHLTVSDDGGILYAMDHYSRAVARVNLTTLSPLPVLNISSWVNCFDCANSYRHAALEFTRISGKPVLLTSNREILDAVSGESLSGDANSFPTDGILAVSGNGRTAYVAGMGVAPHSVEKVEIRYSHLDEQFSVTSNYVATGSAFARGLSVNHAGDKAYRACWYPNQIEVYSSSQVTSIDSGTNGGARLIDENTLLCARYYDNDTPDLWVVDLPSGQIMSEYSVNGDIDERQFVISGDGLRFIARSSSWSVLTFITR